MSTLAPAALMPRPVSRWFHACPMSRAAIASSAPVGQGSASGAEEVDSLLMICKLTVW